MTFRVVSTGTAKSLDRAARIAREAIDAIPSRTWKAMTPDERQTVSSQAQRNAMRICAEEGWTITKQA